MSEDPYPPISDTDDTDAEESDQDSCTSDTNDTLEIQVTQIEITRDMEKWMEAIQLQYETYCEKAVKEILDILSLETT